MVLIFYGSYKDPHVAAAWESVSKNRVYGHGMPTYLTACCNLDESAPNLLFSYRVKNKKLISLVQNQIR